MTESDDSAELSGAQEGMDEPWSADRYAGWNAGYVAGLNDATKIAGDALRDALARARERKGVQHG